MSDKKPQPLIIEKEHDQCPICGEISYSFTGVHPQCAMRQADAQRLKRLKRLKRDKPRGRTTLPGSGVKAWEKICPKCRAVQHVRKKVCVCGHRFAVRARPPADEGEPS